jgi:hypothetical protein
MAGLRGHATGSKQMAARLLPQPPCDRDKTCAAAAALDMTSRIQQTNKQTLRCCYASTLSFQLPFLCCSDMLMPLPLPLVWSLFCDLLSRVAASPHGILPGTAAYHLLTLHPVFSVSFLSCLGQLPL